MSLAFTIFDTAIGSCGIAWSDDGIVGVQLPEETDSRRRARLLRRYPGAQEAAPPSEVADAIGGIVALLRGGNRDLAHVALDMRRVPLFHRRVYDHARKIPPGERMTYGEIAARLGDPGAARAVGQALGRNPFPIIVPCHRVVAAGGRLGGFSARGGALTKARLLAIEASRAKCGAMLFDDLPHVAPPRRPDPQGGSDVPQYPPLVQL